MSGLTLTDKMAQMLLKCSRGRVQMSWFTEKGHPGDQGGLRIAANGQQLMWSSQSTRCLEFHTCSAQHKMFRLFTPTGATRHPLAPWQNVYEGVTTSNDECLTSILHGFGCICKVNKRVDMNIQVSRIEFKAATPACSLLYSGH